LFSRHGQTHSMCPKDGRHYRHATFERWRDLGDESGAAFAIDGEDGAVLPVRPSYQQPMIEAADGIEDNTGESVDGGDVGEVGGMTVRIDAGDSKRFVGTQDEHVVAREVTSCDRHMKSRR